MKEWLKWTPMEHALCVKTDGHQMLRKMDVDVLRLLTSTTIINAKSVTILSKIVPSVIFRQNASNATKENPLSEITNVSNATKAGN